MVHDCDCLGEGENTGGALGGTGADVGDRSSGRLSDTFCKHKTNLNNLSARPHALNASKRCERVRSVMVYLGDRLSG